VNAVAQAVAEGVLPGRVWLYSNYHCNLACSYCLTESAPKVSRRELSPDHMVEIALQARALGFTALGITGGEPFLLPHMPETIARVASLLPVVVLTNGTVFNRARLERMRPLADLPVWIQISLDSADPVVNDSMRGPENWSRVIDAIPALTRSGIRVRIATTVEEISDDDLARLCSLHRELGVADEDHVVRPIIRRGRAVDHHLGILAEARDLPPELTITADGAFWSPFGPTVHGGKLDTDLLVSRVTVPLARPASALLRLVAGRPRGSDAQLHIR
jgi:MoaA/NifB/PqqE/SkfB family radical SAM enzyme